MNILETSIDYLKGVGPARADLFKKELHIFTYADLLHHYPFRYIDKSRIYQVKDLVPDMPYIQLKGQVIKIEEKGQKRSKRLIAHFKDETGTIELVWFKGMRWIRSGIKLNQDYIIFGKPSDYRGEYNIVHPEMELQEEQKSLSATLQPVYHTTEKLNSKGLNSRAIAKLTNVLLSLIINHIDETLSPALIAKLNLPSKEQSFFDIHHPKDSKALIRAQKRLKFEEFFFLQLHLLKLKISRIQKSKGYPFVKLGDIFNDFYNNKLSLTLTNAQKKVLKEIRVDLKKPQQMNRLLQGDVGSGKTLVALLSMLMAVDNNYQACIMAPTEILAQQHYKTIAGYLEKMDLNVAILTGSSKVNSRKVLFQQLEQGEINLIIGTHALLEDNVKFNNLGLVVIDEQHRFGVAQRARLWKKNKYPPHVLVMTATPIPRTLSMTLYGDLDISIIDELPPGRKNVKTIWKTDSSRLQIINFIREQIILGRQIYIVFPLIQESEKLDYKDLIEGYNNIEREFPLPKFQVSVVHGQMKAEDKEYEMKRFVDGVTNIMVATTVIEVGVDVPNASVMIIESAERFGLSQLHQLRGRVGRGAEQSYCVLMSGNKLSNEAKTRLKTMVDTNDGFKISEVDLELRGPGDMMGTKQSGILDFKIADIVTDNKILNFARKEADILLKEDANLEKVENINIARAYSPYARERMGWSRIS
tara:strand:- start:43627 stop:45723 length:2097 start_codon:yes stop_codon:yes gene_type:complete